MNMNEEKKEFSHVSVLLHECIDGLNISRSGVYVDCTTGGGGHSSLILKNLSDSGKLICFDQDKEAIEYAKTVLHEKPIYINKNFSEIKNELNKLGINKVNGVLMDLGVSSYQLDNRERGFSYLGDAPLDMRMSGEGMSAFDVVNEYDEEKLRKILYEYGEEKYARGIVSGIVKRRNISPIKTTSELAEIIRENVPYKQREKKNPARKTFQAIRIEVNRELDVLKKGLNDAFDLLESGGRLVIITFHSLEDRIVKNLFKEYITGCTCPHDFPICVCGNSPKGQIVNKKPITATDEELENNHRSRSAKLRIIEKI